MVDQGLIAEVEGLLKAYPQQPTALQALGYKEIVWYLQGQIDLDQALEILKRDTRRYAKRQLSWFKRNQRIHWFNLSEQTEAEMLQAVLSIWK